MKHGIVFASVAILATGLLAPSLEAQGRQCSGNGDVLGSFGVLGSRSDFFLLGATAAAPNSPSGLGPMIPVPVTPPGTTGTTAPFVGSNTGVGNLLTGLQNPNVFSSVGRVFADGMGNLYASPTAGLMTNILVGSYTVTTSCSVTVTLTDPFVTTTGTTTVSSSAGTAPSVTLQGFVSLNGTEIDLAGPNGATVILRRTAQAGNCSNASLTGNLTVFGSGFYTASAGNGIPTTTGTAAIPVTTPAQTTPGAFTNGTTISLGTPFNVLGRFGANGSGMLTTDASGLQSAQALNITGSYSVNADCTGTGHLVDSAGVTRNISFVLVNRAAQCSIGGGQNNGRQELDFVFSDPGVMGGGIAQLE
jgi:hypothetical protein